MRGFAPSVIAFAAGVAWLLLTTSLIPASESDENSQPVQLAAADSTTNVCASATMLARLAGVNEASGVAVSRRTGGVLWTHNDSGQPLLYAVATDGQLRGTVQVAGAEVDDWEDVAVSPCTSGSCVYIADIGDNKEARRNITIYRVPEPALTDTVTARAEAFAAVYPEGPQDAEGFFVGPDGALYVVTKGEDSPISVYRFPASLTPETVMQLQRVATLAGNVKKDRRVTDADLSPDGKWVALRTLESVEFYRADTLLRGEPGTPIVVDVTNLREPQGEGLGFDRDGTIFLAGEGGDGTRGGTLARLSCKLP
jgi:hypothetical protein